MYYINMMLEIPQADASATCTLNPSLQATLPKVVGLRSDTQRSSCSSRQDFICDNNRSDHLLIVFPGKSVLLRSLAVDGHCFF